MLKRFWLLMVALICLCVIIWTGDKNKYYHITNFILFMTAILALFLFGLQNY